MTDNSKKEIIIAVIVGLITGLSFSYFLYTVRKKPIVSENRQPAKKITLSASNKLPKQKTAVNHLNITSPLDNLLVSKPKIVIIGEAPKNSTVILLSENEEKIMEMGNKENFQIEVNLVEGENQLNLTAFLKDNQEENVNLTIIYQKEE